MYFTIKNIKKPPPNATAIGNPNSFINIKTELMSNYLLLINYYYYIIVLTYKEKIMSDIHDKLTSAFESYKLENEKFSSKGVKAAGTRARKALLEIAKATKERRKEIQEQKSSA